MPKAKRDGGIGRRAFLTVVGASAGAAVLAKATRSSAQSAPLPGANGSAKASPVPWQHDASGVFAHLHPGTRIDRWVVAKVHAVTLGAVPVALAGEDGVAFQVDVLRRDQRSAAVGASPSLAVYVVNGGGGTQRTHEDHGLAAMALAAHLAEREQAGASVPKLLTHAQRTARHPRGVFNVLK